MSSDYRELSVSERIGKDLEVVGDVEEPKSFPEEEVRARIERLNKAVRNSKL